MESQNVDTARPHYLEAAKEHCKEGVPKILYGLAPDIAYYSGICLLQPCVDRFTLLNNLFYNIKIILNHFYCVGY